MKCRKCHAEAPPDANFCPRCGAKLEVSHATKRRGNGQGTAYKLPDGSWAAQVVVGWKPSETKQRLISIKKTKSGFKTKSQALEYLSSLSDVVLNDLTFSELYEKWLPTHKAGKSTLDCYKAAYKHFSPLYRKNFRDITVDNLQDCIDKCPSGQATRKNMRTLATLLYGYAIPRNIATLNIAQYLRLNAAPNTHQKDGLPSSAVALIEKNVGKVYGADYVLCQCYLGFRPSELLDLDIKSYNAKEKAFIGGAKTEAGKNRTVTISPKIQPIIDTLINGKTDGPVFSSIDGKKMPLKAYRALFYDVLDACGIENPEIIANGAKRRKYTPHSCRHTFATLIKRVPGADKDKLELIGHTDTKMLRHYQDVEFEDLRKITDAI